MQKLFTAYGFSPPRGKGERSRKRSGKADTPRALWKCLIFHELISMFMCFRMITGRASCTIERFEPLQTCLSKTSCIAVSALCACYQTQYCPQYYTDTHVPLCIASFTSIISPTISQRVSTLRSSISKNFLKHSSFTPGHPIVIAIKSVRLRCEASSGSRCRRRSASFLSTLRREMS